MNINDANTNVVSVFLKKFIPRYVSEWIFN